MIDTIIKTITFIPWIIYFIEIMLYRINVLEEKECNRDKYFKYINKNFFKSINLKELVLFTLFIIFMQYENTTVLEILFPAIYLYLTIEFFHTLQEDCTKMKNKWLMIVTVFLIVLFVAFFVWTRHLYTTYIMMFSISLLSSFVVYIFHYIYNLFTSKAIKK